MMQLGGATDWGKHIQTSQNYQLNLLLTAVGGGFLLPESENQGASEVELYHLCNSLQFSWIMIVPDTATQVQQQLFPSSMTDSRWSREGLV